MSVLAIVQARTSSSRLPGKVLAPILEQPMIIRQLERISRSEQIGQIVVATSDHPTDDHLANVLMDHGVTVRRGPLDDVFSRYAMVVSEYAPQHVVRLTADCPLTDPEVIDLVVESHLKSGADYTSNTLDRRFPHGLDAECMKVEAFQKLAALRLSQQEREHVTLGMYSRPLEFTLNSVTQQENISHLRWTVDYPQDLIFVTKIYEALYPANPVFATTDVRTYLLEHPECNRTASDV